MNSAVRNYNTKTATANRSSENGAMSVFQNDNKSKLQASRN